MLTRARFVMLGAIVVAIVLFAPELGQRATQPVPTAHQPVLIFTIDPLQTEDVAGQIEAMDRVISVELTAVPAGQSELDRVTGRIEYDGFSLAVSPETRFDRFNAVARPMRPRFSRAPQPEQIDAVMMELEALLEGSDPGSALFISDAELRASL